MQKRKGEVLISTPEHKYSIAASHQINMQRLVNAHYFPTDPVMNREFRKNGVELLSKTVETIISILNPKIVLEIGSHEASFSRRLSQSLSESRIIAFEANPDVYARYHHEVSSCGVEFLNACVSNTSEKVEFHVPIKRDNLKTTMGSILADSWADAHRTYQVPALVLDEFLGSSDESNAMWIDVEGAVRTVLDGARSTLRNCVALFVELETTERWPGQAMAHDVIPILTEAGLVPLLTDNQREWQFNVLFTRPEALHDPRIVQACVDYVVGIQSPR